MTMIPVSRDDPRVTKAAKDLELTMIMSAWIHGGVLYIATPYQTCEVPATGFGKTDTSPRGPKQAASPQGGSDPPQADARPAAADPEPPKGLHDFTAIDGVGPVTAQKLHNLGYYTYNDLRHLPDIIDTPTASISSTRINQIRAWLDQRLV